MPKMGELGHFLRPKSTVIFFLNLFFKFLWNQTSWWQFMGGWKLCFTYLRKTHFMLNLRYFNFEPSSKLKWYLLEWPHHSSGWPVRGLQFKSSCGHWNSSSLFGSRISVTAVECELQSSWEQHHRRVNKSFLDPKPILLRNFLN